MSMSKRQSVPTAAGRGNFELQLTKALSTFGLVGMRGPEPAVISSKDRRGPAVALARELNGAFAAELVVRLGEGQR